MAKVRQHARKYSQRASSLYGVYKAGEQLYRTGREAYDTYKRYNKKTRVRESRGKDNAAPLYGSTFTSKVTYKKKRVPRRTRKKAKRHFQYFLKNTLKLQNPQNTVVANVFKVNTLTDAQNFGSIDLLNAGSAFELLKSQLPASQPQVQYRDFELWLKTFRCRFFMKNTGTRDVHIDFYYCEPRYDISFQALGFTGATGPFPSNGGILANYINGFTSIDSLPDPRGDTKPASTYLGTSPFTYENFCKQFVIKRVRTVVIPAGGNYEEYSTVLNRKINAARFTTINYNPALNQNELCKVYLKNMSKIVLWRQRGAPDGTPVAALESEVTVAWEENATCKVCQTRPGSTGIMASEG